MVDQTSERKWIKSKTSVGYGPRMRSARLICTLLLASTLVVPATGAALLLPIEQPEALAPWGLHADTLPSPGAQATADLSMDIARKALTLSAAGDIDADGVDDLILQTMDLRNGFTLVEAVSGNVLGSAAGFHDTMWTVVPDQGSITGIVGDLTGDGIPDMVVTQVLNQGTAQMNGVSEAALTTADQYGRVLFQAVDGASATATLDVGIDTALHTQAAGVAQLGLQRVTQTTGMVQATGTGALLQIEQQIESTQASLLQQLPLDALSSVEAEAVLKVLDAQGKVRGTITLDDPGVNPLLAAAQDLDMDGLPETVLMEVQKLNPTEQASTIIPVISSYAGATVALDWEVTMDPLAGLPLLVPNVGDLNGDGVLELAYHAISATPGSDPSGTVLTILDGATGQALATAEVADGLLIAAPLGGSISGKVAADVLLLEGTVDAITSVAVAGSNLQTIWSIDIPANAIPLNLVTDPFTGAVQGLQDLTGDGVPDLAIAKGIVAGGPLSGDVLVQATGQDVVLEVYSGIDGTLVWSKDLGSAIALEAVQGLTTDGSAAFAAIVAQGTDTLENGLHKVDSVSLLILQAVDGAGVLELPLLEADVIAGLGEDVAVSVHVEAAGDVNGDGVTDLLVRVEAVIADTADAVVHEVQGQAIAATEQAVDQVYVVSGATGEVLDAAMETSQAAIDNVGAILEDVLSTGAVLQLEAYGGVAAPGSVDTPALGPLAALSVALAVALIRRRQH